MSTLSESIPLSSIRNLPGSPTEQREDMSRGENIICSLRLSYRLSVPAQEIDGMREPIIRKRCFVRMLYLAQHNQYHDLSTTPSDPAARATPMR
jgi:hypothetical protein